ncbi:MAG: diguanylate cyclase [Geminicoccaceae bacterium]|nr:diguanylate cyclase [Geminicoccaceae bacterium]MCB9944527.1 diguanylate cyclase [Geminicoccaceae bacterium]
MNVTAAEPPPSTFPFPCYPDEPQRLDRLKSYEILDTPPEEAYDRITRLVADLLDAPIALVSLSDAQRQWFKSIVGAPVSEIPRHRSFCGHAIHGGVQMVVEDASRDERFRDNPLVTGDLGIRFYAGSILRSRDGFNLGTLCALDNRVRKLSRDQAAVLEDLAQVIADELELRQVATRAVRAEQRLVDAIEALPDGFALFDADDRLLQCNSAFTRVFGETCSVIRPGTAYVDILRNGLEKGYYPDALGREEAWLAQRMAGHAEPKGPVEQRVVNDCWVRIHESRTREGGSVGYRIDITDSKRYEQLLKTMAWTDSLTGLLNRRRFLELGEKECGRAVRKKLSTSVLIIDVDHFKSINDTYGHDGGDKVLVTLARRWTEFLRQYDVLGRYGGEEFAIFLPDTGIENACVLASRILSIAAAEPVLFGSQRIPVTVSIGVAECGERAFSLDQALSCADKALYEAKEGGRNQVVAFHSDRRRTHDCKAGAETVEVG